MPVCEYYRLLICAVRWQRAHSCCFLEQLFNTLAANKVDISGVEPPLERLVMSNTITFIIRDSRTKLLSA